MSASATRLPASMSVPEFLRWESGDGRRYELVDGEPRAMAPPSTVHGFLQTELGRLIGNHLRASRPSCEIVANAGVIPHLLSANNFRIPDLGVTCSPVLPGQIALQGPVLLIEILSPSNRAETWSNVWTYTGIPTVLEILVLHSTRIAAEVLRRDFRGEWPEQPERVQDGVLELTSIGFQVLLAELYARTGMTG